MLSPSLPFVVPLTKECPVKVDLRLPTGSWARKATGKGSCLLTCIESSRERPLARACEKHHGPLASDLAQPELRAAKTP